MPEKESEITGRDSIHRKRTTQQSPTLPRRNVNTRRRAKENRSPVRTPSDDFSDEDVDETDRSPGRLYPDISSLSESSEQWTPEKKDDQNIHNDSYYSTFSHGQPGTPEKLASRDQPQTPSKGTQGRKVIVESLERDTRSIKRGPTPLMIIGFSFLILFSVFLLNRQLQQVEDFADQKPVPKTIEEIKSDWRDRFKHIASMFRQERPVWLQLHGQIDTIMTEYPLQPAVLLVVAPEDSMGSAICLIHTIAKAVTDAFEDPNFVMFDMKSSAYTRSWSLEIDLEESLRGLSNSHAAIVHNIEEIPGDAAMIFHAFCDNENAPFKQAVIFLMIEVTGKYEDIARGRLDTIIDNHLSQLWGAKLDKKDVSAIVSRVANAPLLVKPEERERLQMLCPV